MIVINGGDNKIDDFADLRVGKIKICEYLLMQNCCGYICRRSMTR